MFTRDDGLGEARLRYMVGDAVVDIRHIAADEMCENFAGALLQLSYAPEVRQIYIPDSEATLALVRQGDGALVRLEMQNDILFEIQRNISDLLTIVGTLRDIALPIIETKFLAASFRDAEPIGDGLVDRQFKNRIQH